MKKYFIFMIAFTLLGCKKSTYDKYLVGGEKRMNIVEHNTVIQGINSVGLSTDEAMLNLDNEDDTDITFTSSIVSINADTEIWKVNLKISNDLFEVLEIANSGDEYNTTTDLIAEGGWGYPKYIITNKTSCEPSEGATFKKGANNPKTFLECDAFEPNQYNWASTGSGTVELASSGYIFKECFFNETEDSLLCERYVEEPSCSPIPSNQKTYIVFRKKELSGYSIGWIELMLTDDNKLEIKKSAISNKPLEF